MSFEKLKIRCFIPDPRNHFHMMPQRRSSHLSLSDFFACVSAIPRRRKNGCRKCGITWQCWVHISDSQKYKWPSINPVHLEQAVASEFPTYHKILYFLDVKVLQELSIFVNVIIMMFTHHFLKAHVFKCYNDLGIRSGLETGHSD